MGALFRMGCIGLALATAAMTACPSPEATTAKPVPADEGSAVSSASASASPSSAVVPDGTPKCDFAITIPIMPHVRATASAGGVVHVVLGVYVTVPPALPRGILLPGELDVEVTSAGTNDQYCEIPLRADGVPPGKLSIVATVRHPARTDTLRTEVTVPPP
jgi:hypothetical protein